EDDSSWEMTLLEEFGEQSMAYFELFDIYREKTEYTYIYDRITALQSAAYGTGIYSESDKKSEAMEVLSLVMTDTELADALTYGREGEDYYRDGNRIYRMNGEEALDNIAVFDINCYGITSGSVEGTDFEGSRYEYVKGCWENYSGSPLLGIGFDTTTCREERLKIEEVMYKYFYEEEEELYNAEDFEEEWERFITMLEEAGIDRLSREIDKRIEEMLNGNE
ncbi:MAG: hypothetical protein NC223_08115, partial [Butyrivibrio sp.]|nr:hypothetical protein [Butyrivibrio sp.]